MKTKFKTWTTVKLGTGFITGNDICEALTSSKCEIAEASACRMVRNPGFKIAQTPIEIELVKVPLRKFGKDSSYMTSKAIILAERFGLSSCPAEVGPQLCLQRPELFTEADQVCYLGMPPIEGKSYDGKRDVVEIFCICFNKTNRQPHLLSMQYLNCYSRDTEFIFAK